VRSGATARTSTPLPTASKDARLAVAHARMFEIGHRLSNNEIVYISQSDWRMHCEIIAATGSGKTTLIENILLQHLHQRRGFCYIDKQGTSAKRIADAATMPVIYWEPANTEIPLTLNPFQDAWNVPPNKRYLYVDHWVSTLSDIWDLGTNTPNLTDHLRHGLGLLVDNHGSHILQLAKVLTSAQFRDRLLPISRSKAVQDFWAEFDQKDKKQQHAIVESTLNKVHALAYPEPLRVALGQPHSTVNIRRIMDNGTPLILNLSGMGNEAAAFLGAIVVSSFSIEAERRAAELPEEDRNDYSLVIDEVQNFARRTLPTILSEKRQQRLSLCVAHQYVSQLDDKIRDGIFGNVGSIIVMRVGAQDAPILAKATGAPESELQTLPRGHAWARISVDAQPHRPLPIRTALVELPKGNLASAKRNTIASYARTGRRKRSVQARRGWKRGGTA